MDNKFNETILIRQVAKGCRQSFSILFKIYYPKLGAYLFRLTKDEVAVEEIVQETFIKVWTQRDRLSKVTSFEGYVITITKNLALNFIRDQARKTAREEEFQKTLMNEANSSDEPCWIHHFGPAIDQAIAKLPPQQKKVYLLVRHDKLNYTDVAKITGLSIETIRKHMHLALTRLRKEVKAIADQDNFNETYFILLNFLLPLF